MNSAIAAIDKFIVPPDFSHASGYLEILRSQLADVGVEPHTILTKNMLEYDWNDYDAIYLWQGLDLNGKLGINVYGTNQHLAVHGLEQLSNFTGQLIPIIYPLLDYPAMANCPWMKKFEAPRVDWHRLVRLKLRTLEHVIENPNESAHLCVGDSHILSAWRDHTHVKAYSGLTLHGALRAGLGNLIPESYESVTIYLGNIDVRHHLCRQPGPAEALKELVFEYVTQLHALSDRLEIELVQPLPIEHPSRKVPKPGQYKGEPFYGTWQERVELRDLLDAYLEEACRQYEWFYFRWPDYFTNERGELHQGVMERPRSVHVAPRYYRMRLESDSPPSQTPELPARLQSSSQSEDCE